MDIFIFKAFWPELFLSLSIIFLLLFDSQLINSIKFNFPILNSEIFFQIVIILFYLLILLLNNKIFGFDYNFFFISDLSSKIIKFFLINFCLLSFIIVWRSFVLQKLNFFEYFIIYLIAILSLLFLVNAFNLISIYLCLELQAISFYILTSFHRNSIFSSEAGLKYFISSSLMSGLFLLGCVFLYGGLGSLNLHSINILTSQILPINCQILFLIITVGIFCILSTIFFKLAIAPYHMWFPQIYDGAPLSSTIIFSTIPKIVLFSLLIKIWSSIFYLLVFSETIIFLIGIYSIFFGLVKLLKQKRIKKLYIYSSISQMGLPLCSLANNTLDSFGAVYFFLIIYLITSLLMWGTLVLINSNQISGNISVDNDISPVFISLFNSLLKQNALLAFCFLFLFFSLAAIPPFSGFLSKIYIYLILVQNYKYEAAVIILYVSTFGVYYYIKILKIMFFENLILSSHFKSQNFFKANFLICESTLFAFSLFLLVFLCFFPNLAFLNCLKFIFYPL